MAKLANTNPSPKEKSLKASEMYDDALPVRFKQVTNRKNAQKVQTLAHSEAELSPYIIHLSRDENALKKTPEMEYTLDALLAEEQTIHVRAAEGNLAIVASDLYEQMRELDLQTPKHTPLPEAKGQMTAAVSSHHPAELPRQEVAREDLHAAILEHNAEILAEELEEEDALETVQLPDFETIAENAAAEFKTTAEEPIQIRKRERFIWFRLPAFKHAHHKAAISFTILSFALVAPLSAMNGFTSTHSTSTEIMERGAQGAADFYRAASALEDSRYSLASTDFERAAGSFQNAQDNLKEYGSALAFAASVLPQTDKTYSAAKNLLIAGEELSEAAEELSASSSLNLVTKLGILTTYVERALPHMRKASEATENIDLSAIPAEHQETVGTLVQKAPSLTHAMEEFLTFADSLSTVLGKEQKMRYLVTFQNNTELRATGGFIGSFAEMDVYQGEIENIFIPGGGSYDVQGQLAAFIAAPKPLSLINPRWEFHDSNWSPDFPTSARKMIWFYEQSGGPTVDGVIAINASIMPELLEVLGEIEMEKYGRTINSENFLFETQKIVEYEYTEYQDETDREEEAPKQFIGDLAPKILEKIEEASPEQLLQILDILGDSLHQKEAMLFFEDNTLQASMEELGWSNSIKTTSGDSLMIVNTNIGGRKTDSVIDQDVQLEVDVSADGEIINTLTITKTHNGLVSSLFEADNNVDYLRVYVPEGSTLISATRNGGAFEIPEEELFEASEFALEQDEDLALAMQSVSQDPISETDTWNEHGKTVFGNWIQTKPGEVETVTFTYTLPFKLNMTPDEASLFEIAKARLGFKALETYTLLVQKQSGVSTRETSVSVRLPESSSVLWSSHDGAEQGADAVISNEEDAFIRILLEHEL